MIRTKFRTLFFQIITLLGGTYVYAILLLLSIILKEPLLFLKMLLGFGITLGITVIIRLIHFKPRPEPMPHHNFIQKINASSFPSWHASRMVFLTLLFYKQFPRAWLLLILSFLTILVFYSRIYLKMHDWNDITGGVFVGIIAYGITTLI
jgi:membrane-associated phospholipid phosphatase